MLENEIVEKIHLCDKYQKWIKIIDIFISIVDVGTILIFYQEHFIYIENYNELTITNNIIRIILLFLSIIVCAALIMRLMYKLKLDKIKSEISDKKSPSIYFLIN